MKFVWLRTHFNAPPTGTVDSSDPWYYWCSDERWRMVATYRSSDSTPKERFVYHAAGFGGLGGSSYIDAVILRDADRDSGRTSAGDGTLEDRLYYAQNWRAGVVDILRIVVAAVVASGLLAVGTLAGCAGPGTTRTEDDTLTVSYESPRPWGFGWSVLLSRDGLAMIQEGADEVAYVRVSGQTTAQLFVLATELVGRRDDMANVVDAETGVVEVRGPAGAKHALWDELLEPNYGWTSRSATVPFEQVQHFMLDWMRFKACLAQGISTGQPVERPPQSEPRLEAIYRETAARWTDQRSWYEELMERARRGRSGAL